MKGTRLATWILVPLSLAACTASPTPPVAPPRVVSQPYFEPEVVAWAKAYREALGSTLPFDLDTRTRDLAIEAVQAGESAVVLTSGDPPEGWFATPIGRLGLAVIVHPDNPVRDLALEEIRDLFAGRTASWSEVGGVEAPVQPVLPLPEEPAGEFFLEQVLGERRPWPGTLLAPTAAAMVQIVSEDETAIGLVPTAALTESVHAIRVGGVPPEAADVESGRYPLSLEMMATSPAEPASPVREFLAWLQARMGGTSG